MSEFIEKHNRKIAEYLAEVATEVVQAHYGNDFVWLGPGYIRCDVGIKELPIEQKLEIMTLETFFYKYMLSLRIPTQDVLTKLENPSYRFTLEELASARLKVEVEDLQKDLADFSAAKGKGIRIVSFKIEAGHLKSLQ